MRLLTCCGLFLLHTLACAPEAPTPNDVETIETAGETVDDRPPRLSIVAQPERSRDGYPWFEVQVNEAVTAHITGMCARPDNAAIALEMGTHVVAIAAAGATAMDDGLYEDCGVIAEDAAGNPSEHVPIAAFRVDASRPTLTLVAAIETPTEDTTPLVTVNASEPGRLEWSLGDCSGPTTIERGEHVLEIAEDDGAPFAPGNHRCSVRLVDGVERVSPWLDLGRFEVRPPPAPTLRIATPPRAVSSATRPGVALVTNTTLALEGQGECRLVGDTDLADTTIEPGTTNIFLVTEAFDDFPHDHQITDCTIVGREVGTGLTAQVVVPPIRIDNRTPSIQILWSPVGPTMEQHPVIEVLVDEPATFRMGDGCAGHAGTTDTSLAASVMLFSEDDGPLADGDYACTLTAEDQAGNRSTVSIDPFTVDTWSPWASFTEVPAAEGNGAVIPFAGIIPEPARLWAEGDCTTPETGEFVTEFASVLYGADGLPFAAGTYDDCLVTTQDLAGNIGRSVLAPFTVDRPHVMVRVPVASPTNDTTPSFTLWANQAGTLSSTGCAISPTQAPAGAFVATFSAPGGGALREGAHACNVRIASGADSHTAEPMAFVIDTTAPVSSVGEVEAIGNDHFVTITVDEAASLDFDGGCASEPASVAAGTTRVALVGDDGRALGDGTHTCTVAPEDEAGNLGARRSLPPIVVDNELPRLRLVSPPAGDALQRPFVLDASRAGTLIASRCPAGLPATLVAGTQTVTFMGQPGEGFTRCALSLVDARERQSAWVFLDDIGFTGPGYFAHFRKTQAHIEFSDIAPLPEGGYIAVGGPKSAGVVARLDTRFEVVWMRQLGGLGPLAVAIRNDLIVVVGETSSAVGPGAGDGFAMRVEADGEIVWVKALGKSNAPDVLAAVSIYGQGAIAAAGGTYRHNNGGNEGWYVSLTADGVVSGSWVYDAGGTEQFTDVGGDGGRIFVGSTGSSFAQTDVLVVVTDNIGGAPVGYRYGGPDFDEAEGIAVAGDLAIVGRTWSAVTAPWDDPVTYASFLLKVDAFTGDLTWQRALGGYATEVELVDHAVVVGGKVGNYGDDWREGDGGFEDYSEGANFDGALWGFAASGAPTFMHIFETGVASEVLGLARALDGGLVMSGRFDPDGDYDSATVIHTDVQGALGDVGMCEEHRTIPAARGSVPLTWTKRTVTVERDAYTVTVQDIDRASLSAFLFQPTSVEVCSE